MQIEDHRELPGCVWGTEYPDRYATQLPGGYVDVIDFGVRLRDVTGLEIVEKRAAFLRRELEKKRRMCGRVREFLRGALENSQCDSFVAGTCG